MLPAPLDRPVVLAGLVLLLLFLALLLVARRRSQAGREEERSLSPFSPATEEAMGLGEGSAPGSPEEAPGAPAEGDLAPEPGGAAAAGGGVAALEERIARMEARVDELTDAKERLERQVAAQTEELRVQRAAIARTQRVLRTVARPEDEPSEPAPKG